MKKGNDTLLPKGHVIVDKHERLCFVTLLVVTNAFTIAAIVTQQYTPPPDLISNILLGALSLALFLGSGMLVADEDVEG